VRGAVWAGVASVGWLTVAVTGMALATWPGPVGGFLAGAVSSMVLCLWARDRRSLAVEAMAVRKDTAVDAAMDVAFSAQRLEQTVTGEHPILREPGDGEAVDPPYDQDATPRPAGEFDHDLVLGEDDDVSCGRCGADMGWWECEPCDGSACQLCDGEFGWWYCTATSDWCHPHPLTGRERVERGSIADLEGTAP